MTRTEELRRAADRETWWRPASESWPYPTHAAFMDERSDAEWLAQAFREAVAVAHQKGADEAPDPISEAVRRAAENGDAEAQRIVPRLRHTVTEDDDYNCPHPWCQRMWPMVRAAEARARLDR